jgi:tetratricopeptide (TPR) repeat protein
MQRIAVILTIAGVFSCSAISAGENQSPAEISIKKAQEKIAANPGHAEYYTALAMSYARRARETSDVAYYAKAHDVLKKAYEISPDNFEARKVDTWLLLGGHEFAKALVAAKELNTKVPDDVTVYGFLADANAELGNYADAIAAVDWMFRMKPGNIPALTRAAYLRELHGDLEGALELMQMAFDSTNFSEAEDRAWLLTQISHIHYVSGDLGRAEKYAKGALDSFPGYHYALASLAKVRIAQKRYDEAVTLLRQRYEGAPHPENLYSLAVAMEKAGMTEAQTTYAKFEAAALAESQTADNSNHELIAYYVGPAKQPAKAVELAEQELLRRRDVFTLAAYASALEASGETERAKLEMKKAIATGSKDPEILELARRLAK